MAVSCWNNQHLTSFRMEQLAVNHYLGFAVDDVERGIKRSTVLAQSLPRVKGEEGDAACICVNELLADNAVGGIVDDLVGNDDGLFSQSSFP